MMMIGKMDQSVSKLFPEPLWWLTKDGDSACLELYNRHYSAYQYKDGRKRKLFCGPGEKIVLRTWEGNACFVWRKFKDDSGQEGINCAVFRNESPHLSSELIRQADAIADAVWPGERHYTFVNAERIRSANPGCCFIKAGWRKCGRTKVNKLLIMERADNHPDDNPNGIKDMEENNGKVLGGVR